VERIIPKRRPVASQAIRWRTNAAITTVAILSLPLLPASFITAALWAQNNGVGLLNMAGGEWPQAILIAVTLLVRGFISFGTHFLNHKLPLLWRFHRVHHLDTEIDVSSTVRVHPLEFLLSLFIGLPAVLLFGLSPWVLIFYELLDVLVNLFSHSNIRLWPALNRYLRYVIVTPDLHKVHHSSYRPETDSNFSAVFPIWDILFGTFRTQTRGPLETMTIGLDETRDPQASQFWWLLASPFLPAHRQPPALEAAS
jgi:sterol desaturase/sphingolipid hydroxylase (fatty acid hydroxylase superfamily)